MKVCVREHVVPAFSDQPIPVGARFDDDSPYLVEADCFEDVAPVEDVPAPVVPVRKFGTKKKPVYVTDVED